MSSWAEAAQSIDAAIIAVPNHLHAAIAIPLLERGVHVLVEKPLARTAAESLQIIHAAERSNAIVMVGNRRRYLHASRWTAEALKRGALGKVTSFDFREGYIFGWPVSTAFWSRELSGGGVLLDMGAHLIDQLVWWLGPVATVAYSDDAAGGVEAECLISVQLKSGAEGQVELSRTRDLRNTAIIRGTRGEIEVSLTSNWAQYYSGGRRRVPYFRYQAPFEDITRLVGNWIATIEGRDNPFFSAREAVETVGLIECCYRERRPLIFPWKNEAPIKDPHGHAC
jgi:predicted dehydrogenase